MFDKLHSQISVQKFFGLLIGIGFGFCLQKGGVTLYDTIIGQLLLTDFTVVKVMVSAVIIGMIGIHLMKSMGWVQFHTFTGSIGSSLIGGLIFGLGFALLGYCPGTVAGAIGQGQVDALLGGAIGIIIGTGIFAHFYPIINSKIHSIGIFPVETIPELIHLPRFIVTGLMVIVMIGILWILEIFRL
ncbi:MAG: YeeE/YedE family protein [Methanomicrobiales archaeon]|nr:YeeE/YedE family protein [Methanomicrobiales archaeon]